MAQPQGNGLELFYEALNTGTALTLQKLKSQITKEELASIAKLYTNGVESLVSPIRRNQLEMVKFLVEEVQVDTHQFGRINEVNMDVPPLYAAIIYDCTPEYSSVNFLIQKQDHLKLVHSILHSSIPREHKIEVLEVIGAGFILKKPFNATTAAMGLTFWKESLRLRLGDLSRPSIPKTPFDLPQRGRNVFGNATKFSTEEELNAIWFGGHRIFNFQTQALLVLHPIMDRNGSNPQPFFLRRLLDYSKEWLDRQGKINTSVFILELFEARQWEDVVNFDWAFEIVKDALFQILVYSRSMRALPNNSELGFANVMKALNLASTFASKMRMHPELYKKAVLVVSFIIDTVKDMLPPLNQRKEEEFKKWVCDYVKNVEGPSFVGLSLLHLACTNNLVIPIDRIQLFLSAGANPNSIDVDGSTPLHFLATNVSAVNISAVLKLLLDSGAHLDRVCVRGITPRYIFKQNLSEYKCQDVEGPNVFSLINVMRPLSCYSAQVICQEKIPFELKDVPPPVLDILRLHGAKI